MTAITVGTSTSLPARSRVEKPGLLHRLWAAFVESRMRQAEREIAMHRHLLPGRLEAVGERLSPRTEKDLPFNR
ncbi:hypothetical protein [Pseudorhodoplanes sp.]|jgi:hypothetical protein|uniref:hypothetical protein n=1 Tax=Pseudorhodoplanes sp. TaxID=1934341 RepID=UPI002CF35769|nr:hypothetical protein [Pseudorhodoplanes sp.]HWV40397.1 hypothetical protein [Pseudorhodoplanes sp.]